MSPSAAAGLAGDESRLKAARLRRSAWIIESREQQLHRLRTDRLHGLRDDRQARLEQVRPFEVVEPDQRHVPGDGEPELPHGVHRADGHPRSPADPLIDSLELDGLDPALQRPGNVLSSIAALGDVADSLDAFLDRAATTSTPSQ